MAFNPWGAGELACVGQGALTLWLLQQRGADISLQVPGFRGSLGGWVQPGPRTLLTHTALVSLQMHREPIPETVGAGELTSLCYGAEPLLFCGSNAGQVCVWDTSASRCFLAWEADDGEIGGCLRSPCGTPKLGAWPLPGSPSAGAIGPCRVLGIWGSSSCHICLLGVLLCSGSRLVSGSNTRRLRLWAVGAVAELRRKGSGAR